VAQHKQPNEGYVGSKTSDPIAGLSLDTSGTLVGTWFAFRSIFWRYLLESKYCKALSHNLRQGGENLSFLTIEKRWDPPSTRHRPTQEVLARDVVACPIGPASAAAQEGRGRSQQHQDFSGCFVSGDIRPIRGAVRRAGGYPQTRSESLSATGRTASSNLAGQMDSKLPRKTAKMFLVRR